MSENIQKSGLGEFARWLKWFFYKMKTFVADPIFYFFTLFAFLGVDVQLSAIRGWRSERGGSALDVKCCSSCFVRTLWHAYLLTAIVGLHGGVSPKGPGYLPPQEHRIPAPLSRHRAALPWGLLRAGLQPWPQSHSNLIHSWRLPPSQSPHYSFLGVPTRCYACPPLGLLTATFRPVV